MIRLLESKTGAKELRLYLGTPDEAILFWSTDAKAVLPL